jgi:hypothetical protein
VLTIAVDTNLVELAERSNDGLEVRLLWNRGTGEIVLELTDGRTGTTREVQVADDRALDAFQHPFAYVKHADPLFDAAVI